MLKIARYAASVPAATNARPAATSHLCSCTGACLLRFSGNRLSKMELKTTSFDAGRFHTQAVHLRGCGCLARPVWADPPTGTQSFAIIEDDPTPPRGPLSIGWFMICRQLTVGSRKLCRETTRWQAGDDKGPTTFQGPATAVPAPRRVRPHRYFIRLYALDGKLDLRPAATRKELDSAMQGHILAQAELMGRFSDKKARG